MCVGVTHRHLSDHLSDLVENTLTDLEQSKVRVHVVIMCLLVFCVQCVSCVYIEEMINTVTNNSQFLFYLTFNNRYIQINLFILWFVVFTSV